MAASTLSSMTSSFSSAPSKPVIKRRYAPKSQGGCLTCRSRHVRCDRARPRCSPCKKSSRQCGYPASSSSGPNSETTTSEEAAAAAVKVVFYEPGNLGVKRLAHTPGQTPREARALRYFREVVAERLAGFFDATFWTVGVVRVAQSVPSLRHALVAVASHWENVVVPGMARRRTADWECDDFALQQYTLAITELRESMQGKACKPTTVELLMSNLLFICLEMFQNHYESALRQLSSGLYLFSEWEAKRRHRKNPVGGEENSYGMNQTEGNTDDNDGELETYLSHIFKRLLTQSLLFPVQRLDKRLLVPSLTPILPDVPSKFSSQDQARDSLHDCLSSILHNVRSQNLADKVRCEGGHIALDRWSTSFADFCDRDDSKLTELERRNLIILEMQRLGMFMDALGEASFKSEMDFDAWMPQLSHIVKLGRYIVETKRLTVPNGKVLHYPKLDTGLIAPLYLVASRCRDPKLRREAVKVLRKGPRQEGVWSSRIMASVAERIIEIEEEGLREVRECSDVGVERRVKLEDAAILTAEKKVAAVFVRGGGKKEGGAQVLYETIPYSGVGVQLMKGQQGLSESGLAGQFPVSQD
ncbi:hypothetical protein H2200_000095 [Cladophialophora chaetospira]|uniref:Zn(2)-C6 fungal-type domain-containing protein n=1 Tax=Cladophialophora chaetospira TaxID=386627 RepID=A0AA39CQ00_9EURO|nr:hypothetical protein H2200_000095 [Cladophialophora chaetospira]